MFGILKDHVNGFILKKDLLKSDDILMRYLSVQLSSSSNQCNHLFNE
jgi:hypothetical protein